MNKEDVIELLEGLLESLGPKEVISVTTLSEVNESYIINKNDDINPKGITWFVPAGAHFIQITKRGLMKINARYKVPITEIRSMVIKLAA